MVSVKNIQFKYTGGPTIDFPSFEVKQAETQLILGISGSGKTTLLHILAGLLPPASGHVLISDTDLYKLKESERDRFRGNHIGIVFQHLHLLPSLTVLENILLAQYMAGSEQNVEHVKHILQSLDIHEKASSYPHEISYGQAQRVSIARAVVNNPVLILADEPTSNLDDSRCAKVLELLDEQARLHNAALIIATHDHRVKEKFNVNRKLQKLKPLSEEH